MAPRDPYAGVRLFLSDASLRPEFAAHALARIEAQHDELDSSFLWASLGGLIQKAIEEAADVAAFAALVAVRLEHDAGDNHLATRRARALLTAACQRASEADTMLAELRRLTERAA